MRLVSFTSKNTHQVFVNPEHVASVEGNLIKMTNGDIYHVTDEPEIVIFRLLYGATLPKQDVRKG